MRILIAGASPDVDNTNYHMRSYVAEGFQAARGEAVVLAISYEAAASTVREWRPSLVVVFGSILPDTSDFVILAHAVAKANSRLVFWLHDDPYEFDANYRVWEIAEAVFTNDRSALLHYPPQVSVFHLPLAASASAHRREPRMRTLPELFFCGYAFANRVSFIQDVRRILPYLRATIVGPGWPAHVRIANDLLPDFYSSAHAVLNIGRDLDLANSKYGIRPSTPGPRTFEAALASAAQIYVASGLEVLEYFDEGKEILVVDSLTDFCEALASLIKDPSRSLMIGNAARRRAASEHTYKHRAIKLLATLGL